ncbi:cupin domain-containing protein [Limnohabitans sp.]|jgi:50S ribosomal protein L16 3-hydroxylase|uniref:cupin domain-containing protein n=1 Tax=Limnohabitans sp. TaxID=1907725 RepID=UPI002FDE9107
MHVNKPLTLLGGISPAEFMSTYWQRKPLLVRQAFPQFKALLSRSELFDLAQHNEVESRLVMGTNGGQRDWRMQRGPFKRRAIPKLTERDWTLLVQGVDLHDDRMAALMHQFRFIPDARLDDVMVSYASDGGGVGPHFDSYDVFLLQAHGQRRWRIGRQKDLSLVPEMPLKILAHFRPEQDWVLDPGDMLYLPPRYAHEGIAQGECMTYSVGFRVPQTGDLARELLVRLSEGAEDTAGGDLYKDASQAAVSHPAQVPQGLNEFARLALQKSLKDPKALQRALGEYLTEPKANVYFEMGDAPHQLKSVYLDRRSKMMYDAQHIFLNGESWRAAGKDAVLMRQLANQRCLSAEDLAKASADAVSLLLEWCDDGWLHAGA